MSENLNLNSKSDQTLENTLNDILNTNQSIKTVKEFSESDRKFVLDIIDLFSAIKGKPLKVFFIPNKEQHYITYDNYHKEYQIYTDPLDKKIYWKTALEHEISHFIFDTSLTTLKKSLNKIIENSPRELINISKKSAHTIYNILEDMRIESLLGKIKIGSRSRFNETRKSLGLNPQIIKDIPTDPINALLASRFFRSDLVNLSAFKIANDYINRSEFLDPKGSLLLSKEYFDKVVLPYLINQKDKEDKKKNGNNEDQKGKGKGKQNADEKTTEKNNESNESENSDTNKSEDNDSDNDSDNNSDPDITINTLEDLENLLDNLIANSDHEGLDNNPKTIKIDFEEIEKQLKESNENGLKDLKKLKEKLLNLSPKANDYESLIKREYTTHDYTNETNNNSFEIDYSLAHRLSMIFNEIKGKRKATLDLMGSEVNFKELLNARFNSNVRVFKNESRKVGFNLVIVHDMSGSMCEQTRIKNKDFTKSQIATNTIATMFKSLERFPEIKITVIGFTGGGNSLTKVQVNKLNQVGKLNNYSGGTPLDLGMIEAKKQLDKMNGKKFVIVLTDGEPDPIATDTYSYMNYLIQSLFIKKQIGVFGILIGSQYDSMKKMFDNNFALCDPESTQTELLKVFEKTIRGFLA